MSTVNIGGVRLDVHAEGGDFVPEVMPYKENAGLLKTIAHAVKENMPVLLIGETGVGKTSAVRFVAAKTGNNLRRVNVNGSMTAEDFVGQVLAKDGSTYWKDGVLTEAMRKGYWIVIDEINAASPEILFVLHSLMDDDRYIVLTDHPQREIVKAHPNFRIFATMNPPERYAGTQAMNRALLSRFPITLTVKIPPPSIEYGVLSGADKYLPGDTVAKLKAFVSELRKGYEKEELDVFVSPRDVAHMVRVYRFTESMTAAVEMTIQPRGTNAEQKAIADLARLHFGVKEKPEIVPEVAEIAAGSVAVSGV